MGSFLTRLWPTSSSSSSSSESNEVAQLRAAIEALQRANRNLEHRLRAHGAIAAGDLLTAVSDEQIHAFVNTLLTNPDINLGFVPDVAERAVYFQGLRMGLGALAHAVQTVRLEAMGHRFGIWMEPLDAAATATAADANKHGEERDHEASKAATSSTNGERPPPPPQRHSSTSKKKKRRTKKNSSSEV